MLPGLPAFSPLPSPISPHPEPLSRWEKGFTSRQRETVLFSRVRDQRDRPNDGGYTSGDSNPERIMDVTTRMAPDRYAVPAHASPSGPARRATGRLPG